MLYIWGMGEQLDASVCVVTSVLSVADRAVLQASQRIQKSCLFWRCAAVLYTGAHCV